MKNEALKNPEKGQALAATHPGENLVRRLETQLGELLPSYLQNDKDRYIRNAISMVKGNGNKRMAEKLMQNPLSLAGALIEGARMGAEIGVDAHLVPFGKDVVLILGYQHLVNLMGNDGWTVEARSVREGDHFEYQFGTSGFLNHRPADVEAGKITHYYACVQKAGFAPKFEVWSAAKMEKFKLTLRNWKRGVWNEGEAGMESMGIKTMIRNIYKQTPSSVTNKNGAIAKRAAQVDGMVVEHIDGGQKVSVPDEPDEGELKEMGGDW